MSILIKVKLSQSLVGIRIESTRDERRAVERRKKRNKNAAAAEVCLSNADRSRRLNDREATRLLYHYYAGGALKYSYFEGNRNFPKTGQ